MFWRDIYNMNTTASCITPCPGKHKQAILNKFYPVPWNSPRVSFVTCALCPCYWAIIHTAEENSIFPRYQSGKYWALRFPLRWIFTNLYDRSCVCADKIIQILAEFGTHSGYKINFQKTVCFPIHSKAKTFTQGHQPFTISQINFQYLELTKLIHYRGCIKIKLAKS